MKIQIQTTRLIMNAKNKIPNPNTQNDLEFGIYIFRNLNF